VLRHLRETLSLTVDLLTAEQHYFNRVHICEKGRHGYVTEWLDDVKHESALKTSDLRAER